MEKENNDIAQISFFLAKDNVTFETVLDSEAERGGKKSFYIHDFEVDEATCRFIYFETVAAKTNPPWLDFVNDKLPDDSRIKFKSTSESPNGILLILLEGKLFVAAFGRSAGSWLDKRALEPDFGIKTAMNMCGNEEIRQAKSQSNAITTTQIDRQVSRPSDSFTFGLSEAEDLKYISAHMKDNKKMTLQGRESLTIKVIGSEKLSWEKIVGQCRTFLDKYNSKEYIKLFPNYRNFRLATEEEVELLDAALILALRSKTFEKIQICIPEFIPDDEYSYSYTNNQSRVNRIYAHLDMTQLSEHLDVPNVTVENLQSKKIYVYSPLEDRVLSHMKWPVYGCLVFECDLDGKYFILSDGRWSEVDPEFYESIIDFIKNRLREEPCEDIYKNIDISDDATKKNREVIFNKTAVDLVPSSILFDTAKLKIGNGRKDKEFCDVLDMPTEGPMRIINSKQYKDASSINYLFSQAKFYCEAFLHDDTFLEEIRNYIESGPCSIKDRYLAHIKPNIEDINGQDYRVCLWLLYNKNDAKPTKESIPLIAQYELKLMHDHLRRTCKFSEIILRSVPVKMKQYTTDKNPRKTK